MARTRKKATPQPEMTTTDSTQPITHENEAEPVEPEPEPQTVAVAQESPRTEPEPTGFAAQHAPKATGFIANPSSKRRESHTASVRKLPGTLMVKAGDLAVRLIDAGDNRMGIGIRVEVPEGRSLTDEEKAIIRLHVRGEDGEQTGFRWDAANSMWHKPIVRENEFEDQVPPSRPVAIRLDAERRVESLAEALREHANDPVGYAGMVRERREHAAEAGRIPD